jgi:hypothetical protein
MTGGIAAFLAAVGGTSLVCYVLVNRAENRSARRQGASGDSTGSGASYTGGYGSDGWNVFSWFSSNNSSSDSSGGETGDLSGSDSGGGGGDSGGGGGDGGGGE